MKFPSWIIFHLGMWANALASADWPTAMAEAIVKKDSTSIAKLRSEPKPVPAVYQDFSKTLGKLKDAQGGRVDHGRLAQIFDKPLMAAFGDEALPTVESELSDSSAPIEAKLILLKVMMRGNRELSAKNQAHVYDVLMGLVRSEKTSLELRTAVARKLGLHPQTKDPSVYYPLLSSPDSLLQSSAFRGLGQMARRFRVDGDQTANKRLFEVLTSNAPTKLELDRVRGLSEIGEDYARDYLFARCEGDRERVATVFFHDPNLEHDKFIADALRLTEDRQSGYEMENAIRYGVRAPAKVVDKLLFGTDEEIELGMQLMRIFPGLVAKHEHFVQEFFLSKDQGLRTAALRLAPYFSKPAETLARTQQKLASPSEASDFQIELTNSLSR